MIGILICSCHKDDDYLESQNVENSNFENFNGAKKLENPYTGNYEEIEKERFQFKITQQDYENAADCSGNCN